MRCIQPQLRTVTNTTKLEVVARPCTRRIKALVDFGTYKRDGLSALNWQVVAVEVGRFAALELWDDYGPPDADQKKNNTAHT